MVGDWEGWQKMGQSPRGPLVFGANQVAYEFAEAWTWREKLRWFLADKCVSVELPLLVDELSNNFGVSVNVQTLKNYARVSRAFTEEHRHLQYKWSNFLEWSKWENPVEAMTTALDHGYGPTQMARLRRYGDPNYKKPKPEVCDICGGNKGKCFHESFYQRWGDVCCDGSDPRCCVVEDDERERTTVTVNPDVGFYGEPEPIDPGELKVLRMAHGYDKETQDDEV